MTVIENAYSPDWHFTVRIEGGAYSFATWLTGARMETPAGKPLRSAMG
jgi:hypothetical protein